MPPSAQPSPGTDGRRLATPLARAVATGLGVDLATVTGTGRGGRIRRADVEAAARTGSAGAGAVGGGAGVAAEMEAGVAAEVGAGVAAEMGAAAATGAVDSRQRPAAGPATLPLRGAQPGPGSLKAAPGAVGPDTEVVPLSAMRRTVARRLVESMRSAPHFYLTATVDAEALLELRAELNRQLQAGSEALKVSVNDLIVKACAGLLRTNPELNVSWGGDRLLVHRRVHVGIAVALEGGLVVPVVRDADTKSLTQLAREARELIGRARAGRLAAQDLGGGTFTVSNLGMFGIDQFTAVINPPEAAILAVGAALAEPAATEDGQVVVRRRIKLTLSIDHRALDGATGARFLAQLKAVLEHPLQIVA
jgi:pyruvate dehydrogenase E2 component (dihydrolipoamide acetyltransferase)